MRVHTYDDIHADLIHQLSVRLSTIEVQLMIDLFFNVYDDSLLVIIIIIAFYTSDIGIAAITIMQ